MFQTTNQNIRQIHHHLPSLCHCGGVGLSHIVVVTQHFFLYKMLYLTLQSGSAWKLCLPNKGHG